MDAMQAKALVAAVQEQAGLLTEISKTLQRLVQLESIKLTPEQRKEMHDTDIINAQRGG